MPNTIFSSEGALLFIMVAMVALGFWLQRFKAFKTLGPALTVIIMGIVLSNLRIVPPSSATYDAVSSYAGGKKMHVSQDGMTTSRDRKSVV